MPYYIFTTTSMQNLVRGLSICYCSSQRLASKLLCKNWSHYSIAGWLQCCGCKIAVKQPWHRMLSSDSGLALVYNYRGASVITPGGLRGNDTMWCKNSYPDFREPVWDFHSTHCHVWQHMTIKTMRDQNASWFHEWDAWMSEKTYVTPRSQSLHTWRSRK